MNHQEELTAAVDRFLADGETVPVHDRVGRAEEPAVLW